MNTDALTKMASMPVGRLMLKTGVPMIISLALQAVYNIVDSAFVAHMAQNGEEALNALTLAFPVQTLIISVGIGTSIGVNALLAKSLGQGDEEKAAKTAGSGIFLCLVISLLFVAFAFFAVRPYIASQTQNPIVYEMGVDYLFLCCCFAFVWVFFAIFEKLLQATGRSACSTAAQIIGACVNIILDPVMIYGLLGCPAMGVTGAAAATVIGQGVAFLLAMVFHYRRNREIKNGLKYIRPSLRLFGEIYSVGLPAMVGQAISAVMIYCLNLIFLRIGESVVTAYGLYYKIQLFMLFMAFGLRDAITPIVAFAWGMGNGKRVREGLKYGMIYTLALMAACIIALELFAHPLAGLFGLSGATEALCVSAIRLVSVSFVFAGANIVLMGVFQGLGCGMETLAVGLGRNIVFILPAALIFTRLVLSGRLGISAVWFTFLIGEGVTLAFAAALMNRAAKRRIKPLCEE